MSLPGRTAFADDELVDLLTDEPELLAIADAIVVTRPTRPEQRERGGFRHLRVARPTVLAAAVAVAAAIVVALVAPWQRSHGTLSDLALAALGSQPVVHVVTETATGAALVDISTGKSTPVMQRDEIWYDADLGLRRALTRHGSMVLDDVLETPQGGYTTHGIVYDCSWIAAHPVAATKARVSCNPSGVNGTTPHVVPRPKPTLDPGLAGFADSYRTALASGQAKQDGTGTIDGQPVDWLVFPTSDGRSERVALDRTTHKPVLLEGANLSVRIESIETIVYDPADFARPTPAETPVRPSLTNAIDGASISLTATAIAAAYPNAVWAGTDVAGLPLVRAEQQTLTAAFADNTPKQTGPGLELSYGTLGSNGRLDRTKPYVDIQEAPSPTLATMAGFIHGNFPPPGALYTDAPTGSAGSANTVGIGAIQLMGHYLIIQTQGTQPDTLLEVARALTGA